MLACADDHGLADSAKTGNLYGPEIDITDGDTLTILTPIKKQVKIRLAEIDTPDRGQPSGTWAKKQLSDMVFQKDIAIKLVDIGRYDRIVGRVYVGESDVNAELVPVGAAPVYPKYATDPHLYEREEEARGAKRGWWSQPPATAMGVAEAIRPRTSTVGFRRKREYICNDNFPEGECHGGEIRDLRGQKG